MPKYGMVIDLRKCIGCHTCTIACKVENSTRPGIFWNKVSDEEVGQYPLVRRYFIPRLCMHCRNAPCIEVCPTQACYRREDGIVLVDSEKCIACKYCIVACPYGARYINEGKASYFKTGLTPNEVLGYKQHTAGVTEKCNFCLHRLEQGQEPACVTTCPAKARYFGDLDDPNSEVSMLIISKHAFQLLKELGTDPSVYYLPI